MGRRYSLIMAKKKKNRAPNGGDRAKAFNNPFAAFKKQLKAAAREDSPPEPAPAPPRRENPAGDEELFGLAMRGVVPLENDSGSRVPPPPGAKEPLLRDQADEDLEVLAHLADLITGEGEFDLRLSDEFVQGHARGVGPELLERLFRGDFAIQDYLDLHGLAEDEALGLAENFLTQAVARGLRHVLLVHGRGLGSPGKVPVLKNALAKRLSHKRMQKRVLAFCSARPVDGGAGAMYVLLRKWSGPGRWGG